jgi:hypothetical protein
VAVTPEEQRLIDYEAQQAAAPARDRARRAALRGSAGAKAEFDARWAPLQKWLAENGPHEGEGRPWTS